MRGGFGGLLLNALLFNSDITPCCCRRLWNKQSFKQTLDVAHLLAHRSYGFLELRLMIAYSHNIHLRQLRYLFFSESPGSLRVRSYRGR